MVKPLRKWLSSATVKERERLARLSGLALGHIQNIAYGCKGITVESAANIESASLVIARRHGDRLPPVMREDMCMVCKKCPYRKAHNVKDKS